MGARALFVTLTLILGGIGALQLAAAWMQVPAWVQAAGAVIVAFLMLVVFPLVAESVGGDTNRQLRLLARRRLSRRPVEAAEVVLTFEPQPVSPARFIRVIEEAAAVRLQLQGAEYRAHVTKASNTYELRLRLDTRLSAGDLSGESAPPAGQPFVGNATLRLIQSNLTAKDIPRVLDRLATLMTHVTDVISTTSPFRVKNRFTSVTVPGWNPQLWAVAGHEAPGDAPSTRVRLGERDIQATGNWSQETFGTLRDVVLMEAVEKPPKDA